MAYFLRTLCTYRITESRRIEIFKTGWKIMKIQHLLSGNNTTATVCERYPRRQINSAIFWQKKYLFAWNTRWAPWSCCGCHQSYLEQKHPPKQKHPPCFSTFWGNYLLRAKTPPLFLDILKQGGGVFLFQIGLIVAQVLAEAGGHSSSQILVTLHRTTFPPNYSHFYA